MPTNRALEVIVVCRIGLAMRAVVIASWLSALGMWFIKSLPDPVVHFSVESFKVIAVISIIWLVAETAEALAGRARFLNVIIDAALVLPMSGLLYLASVTTM